MRENILRFGLFLVLSVVFGACGGKTDESVAGDLTCGDWYKDSNLQAGKESKLGNLAGSAMSSDGSLVLYRNDLQKGECAVLMSNGGLWSEVDSLHLRRCINATSGSDGSVSIVAIDDSGSSVSTTRSGQGTWSVRHMPADKNPTAVVQDVTGVYALFDDSPISLNGNITSTVISKLDASGWAQDAVEITGSFKLNSFGYLNGSLAAYGSSIDDQGNEHVLILVRGENSWAPSPLPQDKGNVVALWSRGQDAVGVSLNQVSGANVLVTHDAGSSWSSNNSEDTLSTVATLFDDGLVLAETPEPQNGGMWISGREQVRFTRVTSQGQQSMTTPENVIGIPLNIYGSKHGLTLIATQGVYYSDCR